MNKYSLSLMALACLSLPACTQTWEGLKTDMNKFGDSVQQGIDNMNQPRENATVLQQGTDCPPVAVDPETDSLTEFHDPANTADSQIVSRFAFSGADSNCTMGAETVMMAINLTFDGEMGPKAKRKDGDRPFFSYPYYVKVMDMSDNELAREVFAANVKYDSGQSEATVVETIKQSLPLVDGTAPYKVEVGFALSEEQMAYNETHDDEDEAAVAPVSNDEADGQE
jgi:hypothetical protein